MTPCIDRPSRRDCCAALAMLLLAGCATTGRTSRLAPDDEEQALRAAGIGLYELSAGRLAQVHAGRSELQAFGRLLAEHHEATNASLLSLLQSRGVEPPRAMPAWLELRLARLRPGGGAGFDQHFVQVAGLEDHERLLAAYATSASTVQDAGLRAWFAGQLPALRSHLAVARSLAAAPAA